MHNDTKSIALHKSNHGKQSVGALSKRFTFRSIGTYYSANAKIKVDEEERYMRQRLTNAARAQRNRSLYAIYQKKVNTKQRRDREIALKEYELWDERKQIVFKRRKTLTELSDETKVSYMSSLLRLCTRKS